MKQICPVLFPNLILLVIVAAIAPPSAQSCTGFLISNGDTVLAGNNEDCDTAFTRMWVVPASPGKYGGIFFGFDDFNSQGGINEKGLFFDYFSLTPYDTKTSDTKKACPVSLIDKAMTECSTVAQVIALYERYDHSFINRSQLFFGDAGGDSVIIEGNAMVRKKGTFQVVTNFRQSIPGTGGQSCDRFRIASKMIKSAPKLDKDFCRSVLDAVHSEGDSPTLYSQVYDLTHGRIYLYNFHNFQNEIVIDVAAELKKGQHWVALPEMFPETFAALKYLKRKKDDFEKDMAVNTMKSPDFGNYDELAGRYLFTDNPFLGSCLVIARRGDKLFDESPDGFPVEILPHAPLHFFYKMSASDIRLTFIRNSRGRVTGLVVNINGQKKITAKKAVQ